MITAKTKCKGCGEEFQPGRRSKTYCSNACKQTAYYRRKSSGNNAGSNIQVVTEANDVAEEDLSVRNRNTISVTNNSNLVSYQDFSAPLIPEGNYMQPQDWNIHDPSNPTIPMENYTLPDEQENTNNNEPAHQPSITVMGMQVDRDWFNSLLETLPEDEQRQLSRLLLETINDTFPDLIEEMSAPYSDDDDDSDDDDSDVTDEASPEVYRLGGRAENAHNEADGFEERAGRDDARHHVHHNKGDNYSLPLGRRNKREQMGSYLNRFSSPRIRQGLTIWEELSVTIPSFMEDYVLHYAADAGMLVHQAGGNKAGLVTVHVLFHLAQHRRAVCRLLDLVLEAEDGMLTKQDFSAGGAFSIHEGDNEEHVHAVHDDTSEIDYECFDRSSESRIGQQPGRLRAEKQFVSARDIAMYQNTSSVMQLVRSGTSRRA